MTDNMNEDPEVTKLESSFNADDLEDSFGVPFTGLEFFNLATHEDRSGENYLALYAYADKYDPDKTMEEYIEKLKEKMVVDDEVKITKDEKETISGVEHHHITLHNDNEGDPSIYNVFVIKRNGYFVVNVFYNWEKYTDAETQIYKYLNEKFKV